MRPDVMTDETAVAMALDWCENFLRNDHPDIGRAGAVCPFVDSAMRAQTLVTRVVRTGDDVAVAELLPVVDAMVETFHGTTWAHRNKVLHTLVTVLPDLSPRAALVLDDLHATVKPELAARGLMLGQFHPLCAEPAARNQAFEVSRAPVPMLALRHMAVHDVLFVGEDARCFAAYRQRFGDRYRSGSIPDPHFVHLYDLATKRFAS